MPQIPCKFYLQGNCRNGNNCRFEHPSGGASSSNTNRFGALSGQSSMNNASIRAKELYNLTEDAIRNDLENELPQWIFSAYGPGKEAPEQLFGGPAREQSAEEIRLHYMQGAASGNPQQALSEIDTMYQAARQQIQNTLSNVNQALQFLVEAADKHPNRIDICKQGTPSSGTQNPFGQNKTQTAGAFGSTANAFATNTPSSNPFGAPATASSNPFGAPAAATGSAFGQATALGQKPSPFGAPAFGQPAQPAATSAFGQPSALGSTSAFGRPAQTTSAFGQASTLGAKPSPFGTPAFGQPAGGSAFGQAPAAAPAPAFGQPSQPVSAFGQASALGQKPNPFGAPAGPSPFAAAAQQQQPSASPFGQPASTTQTSSPFAQPATSAPANPFGQPATSSSPFGAAVAQPSQAPAKPFGQPASQPAAPSAFGGGSGAGAFGTPAANPSTSIAPPTGPSAQSSGPYGPNASRQHPEVSSYSSKGPDGRLRMWRGRQVRYMAPNNTTKEVPMYQAPDGHWARIWFPDGPPAYTAETEAEDPKVYDDPKVQALWAGFVTKGLFEGGMMPEVPPKREFCAWNF